MLTSKVFHGAYCVGGCVRQGGRLSWLPGPVSLRVLHCPPTQPLQQAGVGRALHGARPHRDKAEGAQTQCWLKLLTGWKSLLSKPALPPTSFN